MKHQENADLISFIERCDAEDKILDRFTRKSDGTYSVYIRLVQKEKPVLTPQKLIDSGLIGSLGNTELSREIDTVGSVKFSKKLLTKYLDD